MKKVYLIVVRIDGKYILELSEPKGEGVASIAAWETKEKAIATFDSFRKKAKSQSYESHISGSLGIINLSPHIIEMDDTTPHTLMKYVKGQPVRYSGNAHHGAFVNLMGVEVSKDILALSVCDVAKDIVDDVYYGKDENGVL
ncbi:MAG TPA: hypothetical protein VEC37_10120 [Bacillota bacterium]|nr:hypothetical protein [Bacillota bacterium]